MGQHVGTINIVRLDYRIGFCVYTGEEGIEVF